MKFDPLRCRREEKNRTCNPSFSGERVEDLVKPEMIYEFELDKSNWFPRTDTAKYDKRTPGLFKVELEGIGIISLCSKTYYCFRD